MATLDLSTRASRYGKLARRDSGSLSKRDQNERRKLIKAIGISESKWDTYADSTRRRYLAAARRGNTASAERARVQERRRGRRPSGITTFFASKREKIEIARRYLYDNLDTTENPETQKDDNIQYTDREMLAKENIDDFIRIYGEDYVLQNLERMGESVESYFRRDPGVGNRRWQAFRMSAVAHDADERWYWYHGGSIHTYMRV